MEEWGVFDYYSLLTSYIGRFLERNHPITNQDIMAILKGEQTNNIVLRQKLLSAMQDKLDSIIQAEARANMEMVNSLKNNPETVALNKDFVAERNEKINRYKDDILEVRWSILNNEKELN